MTNEEKAIKFIRLAHKAALEMKNCKDEYEKNIKELYKISDENNEYLQLDLNAEDDKEYNEKYNEIMEILGEFEF